MKTVAIFDLRTNDAWDVDFCLVEHSLVFSTELITYEDMERRELDELKEKVVRGRS